MWTLIPRLGCADAGADPPATAPGHWVVGVGGISSWDGDALQCLCGKCAESVVGGFGNSCFLFFCLIFFFLERGYRAELSGWC